MMDKHMRKAAPEGDDLTLMQERMYAYIFPNKPVTQEERDAFDQAVIWQYQHDLSALEAAGEIPSGVESFRIGDFQMAFQDGTLDMELNRRNICPSVYGLLLRHGLLYRGVEGRCC